MQRLLIFIVTNALILGVVFGDEYCDSASGKPEPQCEGELSCYGCTVPVSNLDQESRNAYGQCIYSPTNGGILQKCYKSDSKACAIVKIYNKDTAIKPFYFRGCVGTEDDHYNQICEASNTVLLKRFCYNTIRNVFAVNLPVGIEDEDMADWSCSSHCCSCDGCNKQFEVSLEGQCKATFRNNTVTNVREWARSSMDRDSQKPNSAHIMKTHLICVLLPVITAMIGLKTY